MENPSFLQILAKHIQNEELTFGDCVRFLRLRRNISSRALAAQCGLSSSYVSKVENNSTSPSASAFAKIVLELECSTLEVMFLLEMLRK